MKSIFRNYLNFAILHLTNNSVQFDEKFVTKLPLCLKRVYHSVQCFRIQVLKNILLFLLKWKMAMSTDFKKINKSFQDLQYLIFFCLFVFSHIGHVFQLLSPVSQNKIWRRDFQL